MAGGLCALILGVLGPLCACAAPLAPFEPPTGCYIGAYIEKDPVAKGDIAAFERLTGRKHASYFHYVGYGQPFPFEWTARLRAAHAMPHIAWEPNDGLAAVKDDEYLRGWAEACAHFADPILLRFASEMNDEWEVWSGDPDLFIRKWRMVYNVIHGVAPNVIMVWCPFFTPKSTIPLYYPGDEYVDWVGINIYSVVNHEGSLKKPATDTADEHLAFVYSLYADRKPVAICEYAATHYCEAAGKQTIEFAVQEMRKLYESLPIKYPRVRMINWFSVDTVGERLAHNDYSLTTDERVLQAYRSTVASPYFLGEVVAARPALPGAPGAPVPATPGVIVALPGIALPPGVLGTGPAPPPGPGPGPLPAVAPGPEAAAPLPATRVPLALVEHASPAPGGVGIVVHGGRPEALRGRVTVEAVLGSALQPDRVSFEVDGHFQAVTTAAPFTFYLNADRLSPGEHHLHVIVKSDAGGVIAEAEAAVVAPAP